MKHHFIDANIRDKVYTYEETITIFMERFQGVSRRTIREYLDFLINSKQLEIAEGLGKEEVVRLTKEVVIQNGLTQN